MGTPSSELVVLDGRQHIIVPYQNLPYTRIQQMGGNAVAPTSETIIDCVLTNKGCKKYMRLYRVIADSHEKVSRNGGRGMGDHELIFGGNQDT